MKFSSQQIAWEKEYNDPQFLSLSYEPSSEILKFAKWLKKEGTLHFGYNILQDTDHAPPFVLDLGCGNGRNLSYLAQQYGVEGIGIDFSKTAINAAKEKSLALNTSHLEFIVASIGDTFPDTIKDHSCDIVLDVTASNALYEGERDSYLREVARVMKEEGVFLVRALCVEGDKNARNLLKMYPGPEEDTYILPDVHVMEKVFTVASFIQRYGEYFDIIELKKTNGYQRWGNRSVKRRYIIAYLSPKKQEK